MVFLRVAACCRRNEGTDLCIGCKDLGVDRKSKVEGNGWAWITEFAFERLFEDEPVVNGNRDVTEWQFKFRPRILVGQSVFNIKLIGAKVFVLYAFLQVHVRLQRCKWIKREWLRGKKN